MLQTALKHRWARYGAVQVAGYILDFSVFVLVYRVFGQPVFIAYSIAKVCSSNFCFFGLKYFTFGKAATGRGLSEAAFYFLLVVINGFLAWSLLHVLRIYVWTEAAKVIADGIIFVLSYLVTKNFVFRDRSQSRVP